MTMVVAQTGGTCGGTDSFTVLSSKYTGADGCYSYVGLGENGEEVFASRQEGGNSLVIVSESISYPENDQYYLFFYTDDGETVLCASSDFSFNIDHPTDIPTEGWAFCYSNGENENIVDGDIDVICGCNIEDSSEDTVEDSIGKESVDDSVSEEMAKEIEEEEKVIVEERDISSASSLYTSYTSVGYVVIGYVIIMFFR